MEYYEQIRIFICINAAILFAILGIFSVIAFKIVNDETIPWKKLLRTAVLRFPILYKIVELLAAMLIPVSLFLSLNAEWKVVYDEATLTTSLYSSAFNWVGVLIETALFLLILFGDLWFNFLRKEKWLVSSARVLLAYGIYFIIFSLQTKYYCSIMLQKFCNLYIFFPVLLPIGSLSYIIFSTGGKKMEMLNVVISFTKAGFFFLLLIMIWNFKFVPKKTNSLKEIPKYSPVLFWLSDILLAIVSILQTLVFINILAITYWIIWICYSSWGIVINLKT